VPRLVTGDAEGLQRPPLNRSRSVAFGCYDSQEPLAICTIQRREESFSIEPLYVPVFAVWAARDRGCKNRDDR
jgi:hypothetical protein